MSDEKPKPVDDLKQGLNLLFRAAKGAVERLPTNKIEGAVKDGAKEVGRAFESVANELDKAFASVTGSHAPPAQGGAPGSDPHPPEPTTAEGIAQAKSQHDAEEAAEAKKNEPSFDDAYGPEPGPPGRGGPRIG